MVSRWWRSKGESGHTRAPHLEPSKEHSVDPKPQRPKGFVFLNFSELGRRKLSVVWKWSTVKGRGGENFQEFLQPEFSPMQSGGRRYYIFGSTKEAGMSNRLLSALDLQSRYSNALSSLTLIFKQCWTIPLGWVPCSAIGISATYPLACCTLEALSFLLDPAVSTPCCPPWLPPTSTATNPRDRQILKTCSRDFWNQLKTVMTISDDIGRFLDHSSFLTQFRNVQRFTKLCK